MKPVEATHEGEVSAIDRDFRDHAVQVCAGRSVLAGWCIVITILFSPFTSSRATAQTGYSTMRDADFSERLRRDEPAAIMRGLDEEWRSAPDILNFSRLKQLAQYLETSAAAASKGKLYEDIRTIAADGMQRKVPDVGLRMDAFPLQRDLFLVLMNQRLTDVDDMNKYSILRASYALALVAYLDELKGQVIKGYQAKRVLENVPVPVETTGQPTFAGMDPRTIHDVALRNRYLSDIEQNSMNYLTNRWQALLRMNVAGLQAKVREYLEYHYSNPPLKNDELKGLLERLDTAAPKLAQAGAP